MSTSVTAFEELFVQVKHEIFPRCPHSVYMAGVNHGSKKAPYCSICSPSGPRFETRNVVLPRSCGDPLEAKEIRAHAHPSDACPECLSRVFVKVSDGRECADCGERYRGPKRRKVNEEDR